MAATAKRQHEIAQEISDAFVEAYNTGDVDRIDEYVTEDFVCHHLAGGGELTGADEYKERIHELRDAFPDLRMSEELLVVDGERGSGHYRWGGTHEGEMAGIPATGKTVDTTSLSLMRIEGERMAEMWVYGDGQGLMRQLGVDPGR